MQAIEKICKTHGKLELIDIYVKPDGKGFKCRFCMRRNNAKARIGVNEKLRAQTKILQEINKVKKINKMGPLNIIKICQHHGKLDSKDIGFDERPRVNGTATEYRCKICDRERAKSKRLKDYASSRKQLTHLKCPTCKTNKIITDFSQHQLKIQSAQCKDCRKIYLKGLRKRRPGITMWQYNNKEKRRDQYLRQKYGISLSRYNEILKEQANVCAICERQEVALNTKAIGVKSLAVDHCHRANADGVMLVRGILCQSCNQILGLSLDNPETLRAAAIYLEKHSIQSNP